MTKTGDSGFTDLWNGDRVQKEDDRIEAIGQLDSAQAVIGKLYGEILAKSDIIAELDTLCLIMRALHDVMALVATPGNKDADSKRHDRLQFQESLLKLISRLEETSFTIEKSLPRLTEFILPTSKYSCHIARTQMRAAERAIWRVEHREPGTLLAEALCFLNRASDYLFLLARLLDST